MIKFFAPIVAAFALTGVAQAAPINKTCPVGSRPARMDITVMHEGKEVALCCNKCKAKFEADPAKYAGNIKKD